MVMLDGRNIPVTSADIKLALSHLAPTNRRLEFHPGSVVNLTECLVIPTGDDFTLKADKSVTFNPWHTAVEDYMIFVQTPVIQKTSMIGNLVAGTRVVHVGNPDIFSPGKMFTVSAYPPTYETFMSIVESKSGNQLTLVDICPITYFSNGANTQVGSSSPSKRMSIEGVHLSGQNIQGSPMYGLAAYYVQDFKIKDCVFDSFEQRGGFRLAVAYSSDIQIKVMGCGNLGYAASNIEVGVHFNLHNSKAINGGFGFNTSSCHYYEMNEVRAIGCFGRGIDQGSPNYLASTPGPDGACSNAVLRNCKAEQIRLGATGISIRGGSFGYLIEDCEAYYCSGPGLWTAGQDENHITVRGGTYRYNGFSYNAASGQDIGQYNTGPRAIRYEHVNYGTLLDLSSDFMVVP